MPVGSWYSCQGAVWDTWSTDKKALVTYPVPYLQLSETQKQWGDGSSGHYRDNSDAATSKEICEWMGAEWMEVIPQNFNNVIAALATLFECSTTEGWVTLLHTSIDSVGIDMQT